MIDRNFLHDSAAHRDAVDVRALDADFIHQADSVIGEELGRIGPVRAIGTQFSLENWERAGSWYVDSSRLLSPSSPVMRSQIAS